MGLVDRSKPEKGGKVRKDADGQPHEIVWEVFSPSWRLGRWKALLNHRIMDTDEALGSLWMEYALDAFGGSLGYTVASFRRGRLDKKMARAEDEALGFKRRQPGEVLP